MYVHFWKADHFQLMQPDSIAIYRDKTPVIGFVNIYGLILSGYEYHLIFKGF